MTRQEFNIRCKELEARGYKFIKYKETPCDDGRDYYYKVIDRAEDKYSDMRAIVQLMFRVYRCELPRDQVEYFSLQPVVCVSREIDELTDLILDHPQRTVQELEQIAHKFGLWVRMSIPLPVTNEDE